MLLQHTNRTILTMRIFRISLLLLFLAGCAQAEKPNIVASVADLVVLRDQNETFEVKYIDGGDAGGNLTFMPQHTDLIRVDPMVLQFSDARTFTVTVFGLKPGHSELTSKYATVANSSGVDSVFLRITIAISNVIIVVSTVVGWVYFVAWSISFYPQIYYNFQRKSVVGLNFDFLSLNIVGFIMYAIFNIGLYWIPEVEQEYFARNPRGLNPVMVNDIGFAVHAVLATLVTIIQCFYYERADQRVSTVARGIISTFAVCIVIFFILVATNVFHWLDFLYACSYIKLTITLIKYIPQALMNYRRKSTVGWSIGNILLDFTGGILSMLQMILNAYNYDDWDSIFGDPTKFGLGLFSVCFDIMFMVQHYILYRTRNTGLKENQSNLEHLLPDKKTVV